MTLYDLKDELLQLLNLAETIDFNDPDEAQAFNDTLESIDLQIEDKADGYAKVMKSLDGSIDMLSKEIDRLKNKKKSVENCRTRIKNNLEDCMREIGKTKFKTDLFSFNIQKNRPSVYIADEDNAVKNGIIPEKYLIPQPSKINKDLIYNELKADEELPFATLVQTESLRIR